MSNKIKIKFQMYRMWDSIIAPLKTVAKVVKIFTKYMSALIIE